MKPSSMPNTLVRCTLMAMWLAVPPLWAQGLKASSHMGGASAPATQPAAGPQAADHIVAVVNAEPVTHFEVRSRVQRIAQQVARSGGAVPPEAELNRQVLDALILEKAQMQLAQEFGIRIDDATLEDAMRGIARQNQLSLEQMLQQIRREGLDETEFRANIRRQLTLQRLREREVEARVRVTDTDIDRFVLQKQDNPGSDLQINLAQILVAVPEDVAPERLAALMARAQAVATQARSGADFAALAREHSDAPDRSAGSGMGLRAADRYPVLFLDATRSVQVGGIAGPVRSPAGFHVLKVLDKRIAGMPDAVAEQTRARHILLRPNAQLTEAAAQSRLVEFKRRLLAGQADFAALARENSHDSSARQGGDLGWVGSGVFVPEFEETMNSLAPGQISDPVVSRFGVHLIQVLERRQVQLNAKEQREQLRQAVRAQKLDEAYTKWLEEIRARAYVEFRDAAQ
jgi:peptidyl-prolyl cis-trans isomerase SurA